MRLGEGITIASPVPEVWLILRQQCGIPPAPLGLEAGAGTSPGLGQGLGQGLCRGFGQGPGAGPMAATLVAMRRKADGSQPV